MVVGPSLRQCLLKDINGRENYVFKSCGQECEGLNFEITHTYYTMRQTLLLVTKLAD
jgi:hypothetical protein